MLDSALHYASIGWRVFPLIPRSKKPKIRKWPEKATTDQDQIRSWWGKWPDANIGIATGKSSGFFVLDVDPDHGGNTSLEKLIEECAPLPKTLTQLTGNKGMHYLFLTHGVDIKNSAGKLGPGLDIRGNGGYIVASPSIHPNGTTYRMSLPIKTEPATMPQTWLDLLIVTPKKSSATLTKDAIPEGLRNETLTSISGTLRANGKNKKQIEIHLQEHNHLHCTPPLSSEEVSKIADSVSRYPKGNIKPIFKYRNWIKSENGPPNPTTRHILHAVSFYMNEDGRSCFPTLDNIVNDTKYSKSTVQRHLDTAYKHKWIDRYEHKGSGQSWRNYGYLIPTKLVAQK